MPKVGYRHYRYLDNNGEISPKGGVTLRYEQLPDNTVFVSFGVCSRKDQFKKMTGRTIAEESAAKKEGFTAAMPIDNLLDSEIFDGIATGMAVGEFLHRTAGVEVKDTNNTLRFRTALKELYRIYNNNPQYTPMMHDMINFINANIGNIADLQQTEKENA